MSVAKPDGGGKAVSGQADAKTLRKKQMRRAALELDAFFTYVPVLHPEKVFRLYFSPANGIPQVGYLVETKCPFTGAALRLTLKPGKGYDADNNVLNGSIVRDYGDLSALPASGGNLELPREPWVETVWQHALRNYSNPQLPKKAASNSSAEFKVVHTVGRVGGHAGQLLIIAFLWTYWERFKVKYLARIQNCTELNILLPSGEAFAEDNFRKICIEAGLLIPKPRSKPRPC